MSDRLKIVYKPISELKEYSNNPRINDDAVRFVSNSIKNFGFLVPVVIDRNDIIVAGHTRVKACYELGITDVPCIIADSLTEEQVRAFRLADNKTAEIAEWDYEKLADELRDIFESSDIDMSLFGFKADGSEEGFGAFEDENPYVMNTEPPQYEPLGLDVTLDDCVDKTKCEELLKSIESADVPLDVKAFLRYASYRHLRFDYRNIAEYYCKAPPEVQRLFEDSALVIIDFDDAIKKGFIEVTNTLNELMDDSEIGGFDDDD